MSSRLEKLYLKIFQRPQLISSEVHDDITVFVASSLYDNEESVPDGDKGLAARLGRAMKGLRVVRHLLHQAVKVRM